MDRRKRGKKKEIMGEYVFDIELPRSNSEPPRIASSSSDNCIRLLDPVNLTIISTIRGHQQTINKIEFANELPFLIFSCSSDHTLCLWDVRESSKPCKQISINDEILAFSTGLNDSLLALANGSSIIFSDLRYMGTEIGSKWKLAEYADVHSDIITQLSFHPTNSSILGSGGEDGLICTYDIATESGDEAVISILNTNGPVRKMGFFGPNYDGIFSLSNTEIPSFWHYPSAQRIAHFPELRESFSLDYLVNSLYDFNTGSLYMLCGRFAGEGILLGVEPQGCNALSDLINGHDAMLRCAAQSGPNIFTGGEDGRIIAWKKPIERSMNPEFSVHIDRKEMERATLKRTEKDCEENENDDILLENGTYSQRKRTKLGLLNNANSIENNFG